jgi:ankyrin repeat protein
LLLAVPGADLNATDQDGRTALHYAAAAGSREIALLLVEQGVRLDVADNEGNTAADVAAGNGNRELAAYLGKN